MIQELFCEIAEHRFVLETPNRERTPMLLPSFQPFWVDTTVNQTSTNHDVSTCTTSKEKRVLFRFSGNEHVPAPNIEPVESMDFEGTKFLVYQTGEGTTISMRIEDKIHYMFASGNREVFKTDLTLTKQEESHFLLYLLRAAYGMAAIHHQTIKIHASVTEKGGKALIFLGKSGTGKSTHSRLWKEFVPGSSLLNDDEPIVRLLDDGSVRVYGAPWSGSTPCYRNASAEVSAFVHLYQSPENKLTRLNGVEAFASLFQSSALLRSDEKGRQLAFDLITGILGSTPYYKLDNRPDREAVSLTETLMG